jgi:hypothetical protein
MFTPDLKGKWRSAFAPGANAHSCQQRATARSGCEPESRFIKEDNMASRRSSWSLLLALLVSVAAATVDGAGQELGAAAPQVAASTATCSQATLMGSYAWFEQGTMVAQIPGLPAPPFPYVSIGTASYDGKGKSSGFGTTNFMGVAVPGKFTGTYTVNSDCSFSQQFTDASGDTFNFVGTVTGAGFMQQAQYTYTDPFMVTVGALKKIVPARCSAATLRGTYGDIEYGTVVAQLPGFPPPPFPVALSGTITFDGKGNVSAAYTATFDGISMPGKATGTYTVNPDCSYSDQITPSGGSVSHHAGVIAGPGMFQEVHLIYTDGWVVASGTGRKR